MNSAEHFAPRLQNRTFVLSQENQKLLSCFLILYEPFQNLFAPNEVVQDVHVPNHLRSPDVGHDLEKEHPQLERKNHLFARFRGSRGLDEVPHHLFQHDRCRPSRALFLELRMHFFRQIKGIFTLLPGVLGIDSLKYLFSIAHICIDYTYKVYCNLYRNV